MNLKKEGGSQQIMEGKGSSIDKNRLSLSESEEYHIFSNLLKRLNHSKITSMEKILIIGDSLIEIYLQLIKISPNARFYITNSSNKVLESFKKYTKNYENYSTCILDVSKGVSLHDFVFYNGKFDLVIANKAYSQLSKKKRNLSLKFLYKHYLRENGILSIISYIRDTIQGGKFNFIRNIKPVLEKEISIENKKNSIQFSFFRKNKRFPS
ncbi:MAG: hypothetical protein EAX91_05540 [Candidatus Lokiarchaeota archaeon]|nr:hypothetical protein [Candidatus Lokiarchaeota archaeon]